MKYLPTIFLVFLACNFLAAQDIDYTVSTIPDNLKKNANAVIRLNDFNIQINDRDDMTIVVNRVVTIMNERGRSAALAAVGYDNYRKVKKIEAHIFDASGEEIKKIRKKDFIDHSAVDGGTLYSDSRVLLMAYTPITYPYTVHFSYELHSPNTAAIPSWRPILDYYWSVEKDVYSVTDNVGLQLRTKQKNFETYNATSETSETQVNYALSNISALKPEDLSPSLEMIAPVGMVAAINFHFYGVNGMANNWEDFGGWMYEKLLKDRDQVTGQTKQEIIKLTSQTEDPIKKAQLVYDYVQNNTRYISVQVGIGGNQPITAMEVDQVKYGDCKGLTNYTQALLDVAGVPSYYCVVEAGSEKISFEDDFASLEQGNHIILAVPNNDEMLWLDCTSQALPFGFTGDFTDDRKVLVVKKEGSEIARTKAYKNEDNKQITNATIVISEEGDISASVDITSKGIRFDNKMPLSGAEHRDIIAYYNSYWSDVNSLDVKEYAFDVDKENISITEKVSLEARKYASLNDGRLILAPNVLSKNSFVPKRYRSRKLPLDISRGYLSEDDFVIELPQNFAVENLPEAKTIDAKFGKYTTNYSIENEKLRYNRSLLIKAGTYSAEDYEAYRKFRREIAKQDKTLIILTKKS